MGAGSYSKVILGVLDVGAFGYPGSEDDRDALIEDIANVLGIRIETSYESSARYCGISVVSTLDRGGAQARRRRVQARGYRRASEALRDACRQRPCASTSGQRLEQVSRRWRQARARYSRRGITLDRRLRLKGETIMRTEAVMKLKILLGELASTSQLSGQTNEEFIQTLEAMREVLTRTIGLVAGAEVGAKVLTP